MLRWHVLTLPLALLAVSSIAASDWRPKVRVVLSPDHLSLTDEDAEELYRHRDDLASAKRAADLWAASAQSSFDPAWKLARISYWLGTKLPEAERRAALERGVGAGETAVRLAPDRPEGHFWLAANMGALAESFGLIQGLKYRGRIRDELQRVMALDPDWQDDSAECALGQWYFEVPALLGGSRTKAKLHLQRVLAAHPQHKLALSFLADVLIAEGKNDDARRLLQRVLESPIDPDWRPEDVDLQTKASIRLKTLK
jgi:tetratricopeptide (TPR) repeat protein